MDIADYHIFINLLVNYIKNNFVEYRQLVLIFALVITATLFSFFSALQKNIQFFVQEYIIEHYCSKKRENNKT